MGFGLLGIILGVELQLEQRDRLEMYTVVRELKKWTSREFWRFIQEDAEADLEPKVVAEVSAHGSRRSCNGEFFIDYVNGEGTKMLVYAQKANASAVAPSGSPPKFEQHYTRLAKRRVND